MKPDPNIVLKGIVRAYARELIPELDSPYSRNSAILGNGLLNILAVEFERLIDRLMEETRVTADILCDAAAIIPDEHLAFRARVAGAKRAPANLRRSTVQALNDDARAMLIEVHAAIEAIPGPAAAAMNLRIWAELQASTVRRQAR